MLMIRTIWTEFYQQIWYNVHLARQISNAAHHRGKVTLCQARVCRLVWDSAGLWTICPELWLWPGTEAPSCISTDISTNTKCIQCVKVNTGRPARSFDWSERLSDDLFIVLTIFLQRLLNMHKKEQRDVHKHISNYKPVNNGLTCKSVSLRH